MYVFSPVETYGEPQHRLLEFIVVIPVLRRCRFLSIMLAEWKPGLTGVNVR